MNRELAIKMIETILRDVTDSEIDELLLDISGLITTIDEYTYQGLVQLHNLLDLIGIELILNGLNPYMAKILAETIPRNSQIKTINSVEEYLRGRLLK